MLPAPSIAHQAKLGRQGRISSYPQHSIVIVAIKWECGGLGLEARVAKALSLFSKHSRNHPLSAE